VNAVPNLTSATVTVGATIATSDAAYASATGFNSVVTGTAQALTLTDGSGTLLVDTTATLEPGNYYTVYAIGSTTAAELLTLQENHGAPESGYGRLSLVNLSPTTSSVDVYVTTTDADLSEATPSVTGLVYSGTQSLTLAAGTYRVRFTTAGTKDVVYDHTSETLADGSLPRLLLMDAATGGTPLQVVTLSDVG
jgi:hypothetical protein